jgi:hypothetical protein
VAFDFDLEMAGICEIVAGEAMDFRPVIMFDDIPGHPKGFRTLFGLLAVELSVMLSNEIKNLNYTLFTIFLSISMFFVWRSFYMMKIKKEDKNESISN